MKPSVSYHPPQSKLQTQQLQLGYDRLPIIHGLDLNIPAQKITALIGPNGCGKSTLLKGLARLLKPKAGTVYLDGTSIVRIPTKEIAKQMAILPQGPVAPEGLTVKELVAQGRYPHQSWFQQWSKQDEGITQQALLTTNLIELADRPLESLSGGQRQRAWIAMALAQDTQILLLDEPTTFLDMAHQMEILDLLYELNQAEGRTIVMVLHDLNQACRYADHLVAIWKGRVYAQGKPAQVMTQTMVEDVFGLACRIVKDPVVGTPMCIPIGRKGVVKPVVSHHEF